MFKFLDKILYIIFIMYMTYWMVIIFQDFYFSIEMFYIQLFITIPENIKLLIQEYQPYAWAGLVGISLTLKYFLNDYEGNKDDGPRDIYRNLIRRNKRRNINGKKSKQNLDSSSKDRE